MDISGFFICCTPLIHNRTVNLKLWSFFPCESTNLIIYAPVILGGDGASSTRDTNIPIEPHRVGSYKECIPLPDRCAPASSIMQHGPGVKIVDQEHGQPSLSKNLGLTCIKPTYPRIWQHPLEPVSLCFHSGRLSWFFHNTPLEPFSTFSATMFRTIVMDNSTKLLS